MIMSEEGRAEKRAASREKWSNVFSYHAPQDDQPQKYEALRAKALELALLIDESVPDCADKSAAIRQLRECIMTANAGIALKGAV